MYVYTFFSSSIYPPIFLEKNEILNRSNSFFFFFFFFSAIDKIDRVRLFESTLWKFLRPIGFVAIYFRNYPPSTGLILFLLLSSPSFFFVCPPRPNRSWKKSIFIRSHKFVSRLYDLLELLEKVLYSIPDFVRIRYYYAERVISTSILSARTLGPRENVCSFRPLPPSCHYLFIAKYRLINDSIGLPTFNKQVSNEAAPVARPVYFTSCI